MYRQRLQEMPNGRKLRKEQQRRIDAEDEWHVRHLEAAAGKVRRERRLARAAHPAKNQIRLVEVPRLFPVVALNRELDRLDPTINILQQTIKTVCIK